MKERNEAPNLDFDATVKHIYKAILSTKPEDVKDSLLHLEVARQSNLCNDDYYKDKLDLLKIVYSNDEQFGTLLTEAKREAEAYLTFLNKAQEKLGQLDVSSLSHTNIQSEEKKSEWIPRSQGEFITYSRKYNKQSLPESLEFADFKKEILKSPEFKQLEKQQIELSNRIKGGTASSLDVAKHQVVSLIVNEVKAMQKVNDWELIKNNYLTPENMQRIYQRNDNSKSASKTFDSVRSFITHTKELENGKYQSLFTEDNVSNFKEMKSTLSNLKNNENDQNYEPPKPGGSGPT